MQGQIDAGLQFCGSCERFGWHTFCGECGRRYHAAELRRRDCPRCKATVTTTFCPVCGQIVVTDLLLRWERGEVDLAAEGRRAQAQVEVFLKRWPRLLPHVRPAAAASPPPSGRATAEELVAAINRGFGHG